MSHMVIYRGTDGKPGYHQTDDIHDAVTFVEQLRNDNGVEHARIFRLEEVNFEYRPYFRVELKAGDPALASAPPVPAVEAPAPAAPPAVEAAVAAVPDKAVSATESAADTAVATASSAATEVSAAVDPAATVDAGTLAETKATDPKPPDSAAAGTDSENGVGARRGLFGR